MANSKEKVTPTLFEDFEAEAGLLAVRILEDFARIPRQKPTFADKQAAKMEQIKAAARLSADADRARESIKKLRTKTRYKHNILCL